MNTTVSTKYQIVIPKAIRKQLGIVPGQKLDITADPNGHLIVSRAPALSMQEYIDRYAGTVKTENTAWGKAGMDATDWLRIQRDKDR